MSKERKDKIAELIDLQIRKHEALRIKALTESYEGLCYVSDNQINKEKVRSKLTSELHTKNISNWSASRTTSREISEYAFNYLKGDQPIFVIFSKSLDQLIIRADLSWCLGNILEFLEMDGDAVYLMNETLSRGIYFDLYDDVKVEGKKVSTEKRIELISF